MSSPANTGPLVMHGAAPDVAFYSEDAGLVVPAGTTPAWVLVVDPVDGTRPALAGLESCCVSVAAAPYGEDVTMGDVRIGCVVEIVARRPEPHVTNE